MKETISRKEFLRKCALMGIVVAGGGSLFAGCGGGGDSNQTTGEADPCGDTAGLTETDLQMRASLKYAAKSPEPEKNCANCKFYQAVEGTECGGCQLFKGPVNPKGYCTSWFAMDKG